MFEGFQEKRSTGRGRYVVSLGAALFVYAGAGALVFALAARPQPDEEPPVEVSFHEPPAPPPPPPAPPPTPASTPKPKAPRPSRPVETLREPEKIPDKPLPEAEPTSIDPGPPGPPDGEGGGGGGDGTGSGPPAPPAPPPPKPRSAPQNLPDGAQAAEPDDGNRMPEFPESARAAGVEGLVILKIVVSENGAVKDIQVMKGEEPFVSAAVSAVKTWRYRPASFQGEPIAVFKIVKVPFKLSAR